MSTIEAICESDPGPCINYNKHIGGSRPEREFESLRRLKGHCYNSGRPQAAKNSSKQTGHGFVTSGFNLRSNMARLPLSDILHRGVVYSLVGLSVATMVMAVFVHRDTMQRGRGV